MTLALATRGYLCFGKRVEQVFGPGPKIIGVKEEKPDIDGSAVTAPPGPSIIGAGLKGPQITDASNPTPPPAGPTPVITGAGVMKPGVSSKKR
jgi:hypothetical protein